MFVDQAAYDPSALDGLAGLTQRRSLVQRLVRPVAVVMPCILSQYLPEMLLAENQQVIQALAAKYSHGSFRT
jgi:hypothetical protein